MNINTKQFWESVKEEYNVPRRETGVEICFRSDTFYDKWWNNVGRDSECFPVRSNIQQLAIEFMRDNNIKDVSAGRVYLFRFYSYTSGYNELTIRIAFIDWCINKFSKTKNI